MKNKINKGILVYIGIFLGLVLAVVLICGGIMIISPGVEIAGIRYSYVSANETYASYIGGVGHSDGYYAEVGYTGSATLSPSDFDEIKIITNSHNVELKRVDDNGFIKIKRVTRYVGFYKVADNVGALDVTCAVVDRVLNFNITVPNGLNLSNSGSIVVYLPDSSSFSKDITIETTKGAVNVGGILNNDEDIIGFSCEDLAIKTTTGNAVVTSSCFVLGDVLNLETELGKFNVETAISNAGMEVSLATKYGKIDLSKDADGGALSHTFESISVLNENADIDLGTVVADVNYSGKSGRLFAKSIDGDVDCGDTTLTTFDIDEIDGDFLLTAGEYCDVIIDEISGMVDIRVTKGDVTVNGASGSVYITNGSGSINVGSATGAINLETSSGAINVTNCSATFVIETAKGAINAEFSEVHGIANSITSANGAVNAKFDQNLIFALTATSSKTVNINLGGQILSASGTYGINGADTESSTEKVTITSGNSIMVSKI